MYTPSSIAECMAPLINSPKFADVIFEVGGKNPLQIPAHRLVLAASSPLFEEMLYQQYTDLSSGQSSQYFSAESGMLTEIASPVTRSCNPYLTFGVTQSFPLKVQLPSVNPMAFMDLLTFIYTDKVFLTQSSVKELLHLATTYAVARCQTFCAAFLHDNLSVESVCAVFEEAPALLHDPGFGLAFLAEHMAQVKAEGNRHISDTVCRSYAQRASCGFPEAALPTCCVRTSCL